MTYVCNGGLIAGRITFFDNQYRLAGKKPSTHFHIRGDKPYCIDCRGVEVTVHKARQMLCSLSFFLDIEAKEKIGRNDSIDS